MTTHLLISVALLVVALVFYIFASRARREVVFELCGLATMLCITASFFSSLPNEIRLRADEQTRAPAESAKDHP